MQDTFRGTGRMHSPYPPGTHGLSIVVTIVGFGEKSV